MTSAEQTDKAASIALPTKVLCAVYAVIAVAALMLTWANAGPYLHNPTDFFITVWEDARVNEGSSFVTAEMTMLALSATVLMVIEGRRCGVRFVWAYVVVGLLIAIAVAFPLFLIARELKINASDEPRPSKFDTILLAALAVINFALTLWVTFG